MTEKPHALLVQARGEASPLYASPEGEYAHLDSFTHNVPLDDTGLLLPPDLAKALGTWAASLPQEGFDSRPAARKHAARGLKVTQEVARHLGPSWAVRYWDEPRGTSTWICWGCDRLHGERDDQGAPPHPVDISVEGEFRCGPLRSEGFGDFFPDDPAAALALSEALVADLYAWARSIDEEMNTYLRDRNEARYMDVTLRRFREGEEMTRRLARELGSMRKVTYRGVAHGGPATLESVTWQGDRKV
ncbi:hypothetical protein MHW47_16710 [Streptomyces sp. OfavH-34-F]|uniref:hypothetical protein n=1 Tax=Streptomyces sp. OfavH-34-F TaxID=2917760 RepID=UPI001EF39851|nr:hypothetical protein [Streptomyces sp. OfavH-34-F]MCG7526078.1 hypothetical protein [Streptomyces sp. OfavH-34-F]